MFAKKFVERNLRSSFGYVAHIDFNMWRGGTQVRASSNPT